MKTGDLFTETGDSSTVQVHCSLCLAQIFHSDTFSTADLEKSCKVLAYIQMKLAEQTLMDPKSKTFYLVILAKIITEQVVDFLGTVRVKPRSQVHHIFKK